MKREILLQSRTLKRVLAILVAVLVLELVFPYVTHAQSTAVTSNQPTFEIKINSPLISLTNNFAVVSLETMSEEEIIASQYEQMLEARKQALYKYFTEVRPSNLANYVDVLAEQEQWRKIVTIAFVESTMCKRHYYNNCWGITYRSGLAKYPSLAEGIIDTNRVLQKFYADKTYEQMNGVYVQPKNPNWLRGVHQIEAELDLHVEPRA